MPTTTPRHVICILGNWSELDEVDSIIEQFGHSGFELDREFSQLSPDSRMATAFKASYDRVNPSMSMQDWGDIERHTTVAYILSPPVQKKLSVDISGQALLLTASLLKRGGVAAKSESAGIAHGRNRWLELATDYGNAKDKGDIHAQDTSLYWAWVRRPVIDDDDGVYYSCGMHLLGERDCEIESSLDVPDTIEWMDLLGLYLVGDRPTRPLNDGEG
jgi:hypothetical protein